MSWLWHKCPHLFCVLKLVQVISSDFLPVSKNICYLWEKPIIIEIKVTHNTLTNTNHQHKCLHLLEPILSSVLPEHWLWPRQCSVYNTCSTSFVMCLWASLAARLETNFSASGRLNLYASKAIKIKYQPHLASFSLCFMLFCPLMKSKQSFVVVFFVFGLVLEQNKKNQFAYDGREIY